MSNYELTCLKRIDEKNYITEREHKQFYKAVETAINKKDENVDKVDAFELINKKNVDIKTVKWAYPSVEAYNVWAKTYKREELRKEEFEFLGKLAKAL